MAEHSLTSPINHLRVRVVSHTVASALERSINSVLEEEQAKGAQVIDIKLSSTPPVEPSGMTTPRGEHVALILLRSGHAALSSQEARKT